MRNSRPRLPPLHGENRLKFPFWLFDYLPKHYYIIPGQPLRKNKKNPYLLCHKLVRTTQQKALNKDLGKASLVTKKYYKTVILAWWLNVTDIVLNNLLYILSSDMGSGGLTYILYMLTLHYSYSSWEPPWWKKLNTSPESWVISNSSQLSGHPPTLLKSRWKRKKITQLFCKCLGVGQRVSTYFLFLFKNFSQV